MTIQPAVKKALLLFLSLLLAATGVMTTTAAIAAASQDKAEPVAQPPPPRQGGTCLAGYVVDRYHQPAGTGWEVRITSSVGETRKEAVDSQGDFHFDELAGGPWQVALDIPQGWQAFTPDQFSITLSGTGSNCARVRFQVESLGCLVASKVEVIPGIAPGQSPGVAGWLISASTDKEVISGTTDEQGQLFFPDLQPGTWVISEETRPGWFPAEGYSDSQTIVLESPQEPGACQQLVFANQQSREGCLVVQNNDSMGNPLAGWEMTLLQNASATGLSGLTDASGVVTFTGLTAGEWTVRESTWDGWRTLGSQEQSVTVESPGECQQMTFTNQPLGCIDGYQTDPAGQPLSGWTITALNPDSGEMLTATTDADGYYSFPDLTLGSWQVQRALPAGWEAITPAEQEVLVAEPTPCQRVDFQSQALFACVDVYQIDSVDGAGLAGWEISIKPTDGGLTIADITDGTGWVRFGELSPGSYTVFDHLQDEWVNVTPVSTTLQLEAGSRCAEVQFESQLESTVTPEKAQEELKEAQSKEADRKHPESGMCRAEYRVKRGDTMYRIARQHEISVARLFRANPMANPNWIYPGQMICIP
jgi:uncharacterized protein YbdZ (MbtH family)